MDYQVNIDGKTKIFHANLLRCCYEQKFAYGEAKAIYVIDTEDAIERWCSRGRHVVAVAQRRWQWNLKTSRWATVWMTNRSLNCCTSTETSWLKFQTLQFLANWSDDERTFVCRIWKDKSSKASTGKYRWIRLRDLWRHFSHRLSIISVPQAADWIG